MTVIINASTTQGLVLTSDTSGNVAIQSNGANAITTAGANVSFANPVNAPNTFGYKNRFINGAMRLAQWATSATVTAGTSVPTASTGYPCVDRWFVYSVGANITAAQVAGSGSIQNNLQITGAASVTSVGVGQRIEQLNSYDLAGQTVTLSVNMSNSLLTNVTWTASYANTTNTFGTIGTPTKTQIATGNFTISSTLTNYNAQISVPANATTGIEILFTVGAQTSGTWVIGNAQLELGSQATSFDYRDHGRELLMCQRYYSVFPNGSNGGNIFVTNASDTYRRWPISWPTQMRANPTVTATYSAGSSSPGGSSDQYQAYVFAFIGNTTGGFACTFLSGAAEL